MAEQENEKVGLAPQSSDSESRNSKKRRGLYEMLVPAVLREPWANLDDTVCLNFYFIKFVPRPEVRVYKEFGLFLKASLPEEAERMRLDLHLGGGRTVETELVPSGVANFDKDEILQAQKFQQMYLKVILDREDFVPELVSLENYDLINPSSSTFYLLLPVSLHESEKWTVDWEIVRRCLSSPIFRTSEDTGDLVTPHLTNHLQLANGPKSMDDVVNSLVYVPCKKQFFFVSEVLEEKTRSGVHLSYPDRPLLKSKLLFCLKNLLRRRSSESQVKEEHFTMLPREICQLKIIGFSKDIGSSLSLLPSLMHRLESLLVAIELKHRLSASFREGAEVTTYGVLEALTTEECNEGFSLERLEVLGDAFLKFSVSRHLFLLEGNLEEGQLTRERVDIVENSNLLKLATNKNLQIYIRDQSFVPGQFFAFGRPCSVICSEETGSSHLSGVTKGVSAEVRCNKNHHWLGEKTIADVVEALTGAFLVDSGFKAATAFLEWIGIQVDFTVSRVRNICSESKNLIQRAACMPEKSTMYQFLDKMTELEKSLGYTFLHKGLLLQAFAHPSYKNQLGDSYQRLEHLGDAVLDYLITSYLYSVYPKLKPGQFTELRSECVKNKALTEIAVHHSFEKFMIFSSNGLEESINKYDNLPASDKGLIKGPKVLADLVESFVGASFLDTGFDLNGIWKIVLPFLDPDKKFSGLKAQGYKFKCKSLNKFSSSCPKMEAKLIGYDEIPVDVCTASDAMVFDNMKLQELPTSDYSLKTCQINNELKNIFAAQSPTDAPMSQATETVDNNSCNLDSQTTVSHLYKICADNCWKLRFEFHEEMESSHLQEFTSKAVMETDKASHMILECYGEPRAKEREAMEHAAEGLLWYLKRVRALP